MILLLICLAILVSLTLTAIYIGIVCFLMIGLYPLMKRITYFPQVFLGLTFNMGCLIGYASILNTISIDAVILYISCGFWTVAYDTIYAFMDIEDDKKVGIKSSAIFFEKMNYKAIILALYFAFIFFFAYANRDHINIYLFSSILASILVSLWAIKTLDIKQVNNCLVRFKINNYIGCILFFGLLLEKL